MDFFQCPWYGMEVIETLFPQAEYELLDSGDGLKLERYGNVVLERPDPQALWHPSKKGWKPHASYTRDEKKGTWQQNSPIPDKWQISFCGLNLFIKPTPFKHTGLFPEQATNWHWMQNLIKKRKDTTKVLNLFAYTGGATLACAQAGAEVVHVDSSKAAITWAKENAQASGLEKHPIRYILEDVRLFVEREIKRGNTYDGILLDPPAFGHGASNELWHIEEHFIPLLENCIKLLSPNPLFLLVNGYAAGYSPIAYANNLETLIHKYGGEIQKGELTIQESDSKRLLPCGIFARWSK